MIFKKPSATEDVSQWNFSFLKWATTAAYLTISGQNLKSTNVVDNYMYNP